MSAPQTKRKVMGRINISGNGSLNDASGVTNSARSTPQASRSIASSPAPGAFSGSRKAKVDPSAIIGSAATTNESGGYVVNGRSPFMQNHAGDIHTSSVRSPYHQSQAAYGTASPAPSTSVPTKTVRQAHVRQTTRSPSPSYASSPVFARAGPSNEASVSSRPRAMRPTSVLLSQREAGQALRAGSTTPISAKATVNVDGTVRSGHARSASSLQTTDAIRSANLQSLEVRDVSRSPSPTIVRAQPIRRVSHGSNISTGAASSVSSPLASESAAAVSRRQSALLDTSVKRPSLSSLRAVGAPPARIVSDFSSTAGKSANGLDSPLDIVSPVSREPSSSYGNGPYFTSPSTHNTTQSSNAALLSPATELDAEAVEAKTNRKILDLEITNKSLLAINSGLEVTKLKQAREIRDLRRRLREGRGLGDRMGLEDADRSETAFASATEDEEDLSEEENEEAPLNAELEEAHQRCKRMIDTMVAQARHAIMSTYESDKATAGNRVLHPAELDELATGQEVREEEDVEEHFDPYVDAGDLSQQSIGDLTQESVDY